MPPQPVKPAFSLEEIELDLTFRGRPLARAAADGGGGGGGCSSSSSGGGPRAVARIMAKAFINSRRSKPQQVRGLPDQAPSPKPGPLAGSGC